MHWLRRRIHPVWQVAALSYGVVLGVALAQWWRVENPWALCILGVVFAILAVWRQRRILLVFALVAGLCFGLARGAGDQRELTLYKSIYNQQVTLQPEWCNLALWYGAIFAATAYMKWRSGYHLRDASLVV